MAKKRSAEHLPSLTMQSQSAFRSLGADYTQHFRPSLLFRCAVAKDYNRFCDETIFTAFKTKEDETREMKYCLSAKATTDSQVCQSFVKFENTAQDITVTYYSTDPGDIEQTFNFEKDTFALVVFEKVIESMAARDDDGHVYRGLG